MSARELILLGWRVLVTHREQCREPFGIKLKLIANEFHPARAFAAFSGPFYEVTPAGAKTVTSQPAGLRQLLEEGFQVGTHLTFARRFHALQRSRRKSQFAIRNSQIKRGGKP